MNPIPPAEQSRRREWKRLIRNYLQIPETRSARSVAEEVNTVMVRIDPAAALATGTVEHWFSESPRTMHRTPNRHHHELLLLAVAELYEVTGAPEWSDRLRSALFPGRRGRPAARAAPAPGTDARLGLTELSNLRPRLALEVLSPV